MVAFKCTLTHSGGKKAVRVPLMIVEEDVSEILRCLANFLDKPLTIRIDNVSYSCVINSYADKKPKYQLTVTIDGNDKNVFLANYAKYRDMILQVYLVIDEGKVINHLRKITDGQRRSTYALIKEVATAYGGELGEVKAMLKDTFCKTHEIPDFSLSDCEQETAVKFTDFISELCIHEKLPITIHPSRYVSDIAKYHFWCKENKCCCICGKGGSLYTYERKDSDNIELCLCQYCVTKSVSMGNEMFFCQYYLEPEKGWAGQ